MSGADTVRQANVRIEFHFSVKIWYWEHLCRNPAVVFMYGIYQIWPGCCPDWTRSTTWYSPPRTDNTTLSRAEKYKHSIFSLSPPLSVRSENPGKLAGSLNISPVINLHISLVKLLSRVTNGKSKPKIIFWRTCQSDKDIMELMN